MLKSKSWVYRKMNEPEKSGKERLEEKLKELWRRSGKASVIAARHTEFVVEPLVFIGGELNEEILKVLVINYLANASRQDSGIGQNIEIKNDQLIIKNHQGRPVVCVRDRNLITQYLNSRA